MPGLPWLAKRPPSIPRAVDSLTLVLALTKHIVEELGRESEEQKTPCRFSATRGQYDTTVK